MLTIGLDASNLREGGGVTHLVELISSARPEAYGIGRIVVWGFAEILARLPDRPWLDRRIPVEMEKGQAARSHWQRHTLEREARAAGCDLLFSPGGSYTGDFRPFVTMSRNMLPFDRREVERYGLSIKRLRLEVLRRLQARAFRRANGLIFLTDFARESVLSMIGPVSGLVDTIPHGVNANFSVGDRRFRKIEDCTENDPFRLVYVSHASPYKHQWHLIEAMAEVRARKGWPLRLDMMGPASVAASVARIQAAQARFDPEKAWTTFHGPQPRDRLQNFLTKADLGVFASSCENMPNILLEKMAAGLPIISSDRGPMPEILGDAGDYFDPENPSTIAAALETSIADPERRRRHSTQAQTQAARFRWDRCADDTLAFLQRVASGPL